MELCVPLLTLVVASDGLDFFLKMELRVPLMLSLPVVSDGLDVPGV
jgi:hypothetical protein